MSQLLSALTQNWIVAAALAALAVVAWIVDRISARIFDDAVRRIARRTRSTWDDRLIESKVFSRIAHVVPALVIYFGSGPVLQLAYGESLSASPFLTGLWTVLQRVSAAYIVIAIARAVKAFLDAVNSIYANAYEDSKSRPIKGYLQVVSLLVYIASAIVALAVLMNQSPLVYLSGLGALAAVLMLVFKDTILSLVASVQIMSNDMIRIGDWIDMPQANANGDITDIALHTVKVQNWDKTISTIPTHKFISESFKNWRGMSESGGRRIKRSVSIDMNSVRFLNDNEIESLSRRELLRDYLREKREQIDRYNAAKAEANPGDPEFVPEIRRLTNLGTFRAYVQRYLEVHPGTHKGMTLLVRQLAPGPQGVAIEIYCFASNTAWASYEAMQGDVFDHLIAIMPDFGLRVFQSPAGADLSKLAGALEPAAKGVR